MSLVYLTALSCNKVDEGVGSFEIEAKYLVFDLVKEKLDIQIPVKTSVPKDEWVIVSSEPDWCIASKNSPSASTFRLYVMANGDPDIRDATVTVSYKSSSHTIKVRQLGYGRAILLREDSSQMSANGGELSILVTANVEYDIDIVQNDEWIHQQPKSRSLDEQDLKFDVDATPYHEIRTATLTFADTEDPTVKATYTLTQKAKTGSPGDVVLVEDIPVIPVGGLDNESVDERFFGIDKCWDGLYDAGPGSEGFYHSKWDGSSIFPAQPIILEFYFSGAKQIDYFIYHPRYGDGHFGVFDLYYQTADNSEYQLHGTYDFKERETPTKLELTPSIPKATKVKFVVKSGKNNFVNCLEMRFFTAAENGNQLNTALLNVFTDLSCSELKAGVTTAQIYTLPGYFIDIALRLRNGGYEEWEKMFRIQDYAARSVPSEWARKLMTNNYTELDAPTGIVVSANEEIVVLVSDTHGNNVSLQVIQESEAPGDSYLLEKGANKITVTKGGMAFFVYNIDLETSPYKGPIRVHIPAGSGSVSGFFDLERDKTDEKYVELIQKSTHKYFPIRGTDMMLYFQRLRLLELTPTKIVDAIKMWDNFVKWETSLMGIDDVRPSKFNNRLSGVQDGEVAYMAAGSNQMLFSSYALEIFLPIEKVQFNRQSWGPAHEMGHMHQRAISWPSCGESSNNLFSNFVLYKIGTECSNGGVLSKLAQIRYVHDRPWNDFEGNNTNEDTDMHNRMYWQLWIYFHLCEVKPDFWPEFFRSMRELPINISIGEKQIEFTKRASKAAGMNLTEFFYTWGFLTPVNQPVNIFEPNNMVIVTKQMIDDAKTYMSQYPDAPPFQYIEDRNKNSPAIGNLLTTVGDVGYYTQFKDNVKVAADIYYTASGSTVTIRNGSGAVAFEAWQDGECKFFTNFFVTAMPATVNMSSVVIKAVQADGTRITVPKH